MAANFVKILPICVALFMLPATALAQTSSLDDGLVAEALPASYCQTQAPAGRALCQQAAQAFNSGEFLRAATTWEKAAALLSARSERHPSPPEDAQVWPGQVDLLLLSANAWEAGQDYSRAGLTYYKASKIADLLAPYLQFKAAENLVRAPNPPADILARIAKGDALRRGFPGSELVTAKIDALVRGGLTDTDRLKAALQSSARAQTCLWASLQVDAQPDTSTTPLQDLLYGYCLPDELSPKFNTLNLNPSPPMRLARATRWYGAVRFKNAQKEFDTLDFDKLDAVQRCQAHFYHGRTLYRLRQRTEALATYETIIKTCTDPKNEDERIRALYGAGDMLFWRNNFERSKQHFTTIAHDYPHRSHADDALLYLARIARKQQDATAEKNAVNLAVERYPDGDMLHELVWEYTEDTFRAGDYSKFLKMLGELELPEFDANYYSQGRLKYFAAHAHAKLGEADKAASLWQQTWTTYPFSFYGYLARERLIKANVAPASLDAGPQMQVVDWFLDPKWAQSAGARLANLSLFAMAADLERARQARAESAPQDADLWRLSMLEHLAGRYASSHNIARRKIVGRPWAEPAGGRTIRWRIAWPNPFGRDILRAVVAERRQAKPGVLVEPALPAAIMREESSFIEDIESYAGALGLMQLMPRTAGDHDRDIPGGSNTANLKTSLVNIRVGVDHLNTLAARFDNQPVLIAAAYNAGAGAVNRWLRRKRTSDIALWVEDIPPDQTRNYTKRVIGSYAAYQWLRGIQELDPTVLEDP